MASGTGTHSLYSQNLILRGFTDLIKQARVFYKEEGVSDVIMSAPESITWAFGDLNEPFINMSGEIVFTISQAGAVNAISLETASGVRKATIDIAQVVYDVATFYTLTELQILAD